MKNYIFLNVLNVGNEVQLKLNELTSEDYVIQNVFSTVDAHNRSTISIMAYKHIAYKNFKDISEPQDYQSVFDQAQYDKGFKIGCNYSVDDYNSAEESDNKACPFGNLVDDE